MSQVRIHEMLNFAVQHKASDIHLAAGEVPSVRIDGDVRRLDLDALSPDDARRMAYSIMNEKQKSRFEEEFEVDFSIGLQGLARFRVNVFTQARGVGMVLRQIPSRVLSLEEARRPAGLPSDRRVSEGTCSGHGSDGLGQEYQPRSHH